MYEGFYRTPRCGLWCSGHMDETNENVHTTDIEGVLGNNVIVTQTDGQPPLVALIELDSPQHDMTPMQARLLAYRLLLAADFSERSAAPVSTEPVTMALGSALGDLINE